MLRQKRGGSELAVVPPAISIPEYEKSRSCSKKKAYQALSDFVKERTYVWQVIKSLDFTLEAEGDLRILLQAMREEDRSGLYQRAKIYYDRFRTDQVDLDLMHEELWYGRRTILLDIATHRALSTDWDESVQHAFLQLIRAGAGWSRVVSSIGGISTGERRRVEDRGKALYDSQCRKRAMEEHLCCSDVSPMSQPAAQGSVKRGPPAEPSGKPVSSTTVSSSSVSAVLAAAPKGLTAEEAIAASQARKAAAPTVSLSGLEVLKSDSKAVPQEVSGPTDLDRSCTSSVSVCAAGSSSSSLPSVSASSNVVSGASVGGATTVVSGVNLVDRASGRAESLDGASQCQQELAPVGRRVSVGSLSSVTITDPEVTVASVQM